MNPALAAEGLAKSLIRVFLTIMEMGDEEKLLPADNREPKTENRKPVTPEGCLSAPAIFLIALNKILNFPAPWHFAYPDLLTIPARGDSDDLPELQVRIHVGESVPLRHF